ncbi:MAG: helix-turn-helix domain-containing protein [Alphaproteobacteria bacterium]|nr:helix-turn-helix domain-containing protein [Alphaproteobacteria bacterium]
MSKHKQIVIYSSHGFLKELIKQSHKDSDIIQYDSFILPKIESQTLVIIDNVEVSESNLNFLYSLCSIIIITNSNNHSNIRHVKKPIIYSDFIALIDASNTKLANLSKNIWINFSTKTLVKIAQNNIYSFRLTSKELDLILYIMSENKSSKKKEDILQNVFGYGDQISTYTLETHISRLRKKLEPELSIVNLNNTYSVC